MICKTRIIENALIKIENEEGIKQCVILIIYVELASN